MAHNLNTDSSMFFAGETPWHGLGVALPRNGTWQEVSSAVSFYDVQERQVFTAGIPDAIPGVKSLVRGDTGEFLSIVGANYGVVQFSEMAQAVITAAGSEAVFHTGGLLGSAGERGWLLGELGSPIQVKGDVSEIRRYFLATTAHTGSDAVILKNISTRVVCQNTLTSGLREKEGAEWKIRHTSNAGERVQEAATAFRNLATGMEKFGQLANMMAEVKFSERQMMATVNGLMPLPSDGAAPTKSLEEKREKVMSLWENGRGLEGIRGTAWGAFQAWTEYADHHQKVRALPSDTGAKRLESIWFGGAASLKREALFAIADAGSFSASVR